MTSLWQDIRYGVRMLIENPGFTVIVLVLLGLGVGANTAVFGVWDRFILRPLPVYKPRELVKVEWQVSWGEGRIAGMREFHYPIYEAKVTIIMYMKDSSQGITSVHRTNIAGIVEMTPCVIESILDTFTVIAYKDSLIPDTGGFRILHDNQNIDLWFTLLQDTTL